MALAGSSRPEAARCPREAPSASQASQASVCGLFHLPVVRSCSFSARLSRRSDCFLYTCIFDFARGRVSSAAPPRRGSPGHQHLRTFPVTAVCSQGCAALGWALANSLPIA